MQFKRRLRKDAAIDITSLVDVVFLLLLFFVVTTSFRESPGMEMDLPQTTSQSGVELGEIVISIVPQGDQAAIYLGEEPVSLEDLERRLPDMIKARAEEKRNVIIQANRRAFFESVYRVVEIARDAGARNITFPAILKREQQ
jgi:biopolymer transport protein ExbD